MQMYIVNVNATAVGFCLFLLAYFIQIYIVNTSAINNRSLVILLAYFYANVYCEYVGDKQPEFDYFVDIFLCKCLL